MFSFRTAIYRLPMQAESLVKAAQAASSPGATRRMADVKRISLSSTKSTVDMDLFAAKALKFSLQPQSAKAGQEAPQPSPAPMAAQDVSVSPPLAGLAMSESRRVNSKLPQPGQAGMSSERTKVSNSLSQELQL